jgi:hypothetical protein
VTQHLTAGAILQIGNRASDARQRDLQGILLEYALSAVSGSGMRDFVSEHGRKAGFTLGDR